MPPIKKLPLGALRDPEKAADIEAVERLSAEILQLQEDIARKSRERQAAMVRLRERGMVLRALARLSGLSVQTVKIQTDQKSENPTRCPASPA